MEVILLQDVKSLGKEGDIVKVNDGYARNFILPKKLGVEANAKNLNDLKIKKEKEAKIAKEIYEQAKAHRESRFNYAHTYARKTAFQIVHVLYLMYLYNVQA